MAILGEASGGRKNSEKVVDGAQKLVGGWRKRGFRLDERTDVVISSHRVRRVGRTRVDVVTTSPAQNEEGTARFTRSATVTDLPLQGAPKITEFQGRQVRGWRGRTRVQDQSSSHPKDISEEIAHPVDRLVAATERSPHALARRRLDSNGRTSHERKIGRECNKEAEVLITAAIKAGQARFVRNESYDTSIISGGAALAPVYEATFPYGDGEVVMTHGRTDPLGKMSYDITVSSGPQSAVDYHIRRNGKVLRRGEDGSMVSATAAQKEELYLTLHELREGGFSTTEDFLS